MEPLKLMASCLDRCSKETEEQLEHLNNSLLPTLHEYVLCADNLKVLYSYMNYNFLVHNMYATKMLFNGIKDGKVISHIFQFSRS